MDLLSFNDDVEMTPVVDNAQFKESLIESNFEMISNIDNINRTPKTTNLKLAKNRYGHEEFLAMFSESAAAESTSSIRQLEETCPEFYVDKQLEPVCMEPFNAAEQRLLLDGVNSNSAKFATAFPIQAVPRTPLLPTPVLPNMVFSKNQTSSISAMSTSTIQQQPIRAPGVGRGIALCSWNKPPEPAPTFITGVGRGRRLIDQGNRLTSVGSSIASEPNFIAESWKPMQSVEAMVAPTPMIEPQQSPIIKSDFITKFDHGSSPVSVISVGSSSKSKPSAQGSTNKQYCKQRWFYIDPEGSERGPFSWSDMQGWFAAGYFTMQLKLRREEDSNFVSLGDLIKQCGKIPFNNPIESNMESPLAYSLAVVSTTVIATGNNIIHPVPRYATELPVIQSMVSVSTTVSDRTGESISRQTDPRFSTAQPHGSDMMNSGRSSSIDSEMVPVFQNDQRQQDDQQSQPQQGAMNEELKSKLLLLKEKLAKNREAEQREKEEKQRKIDEEAKRAEEIRLAAVREKEERLKKIQEQIRLEQELKRKAEEEVRRVEEEARRIEEERLKQLRFEEEQQRRLENVAMREKEERRRLAAVLAEEDRLRKLREQCPTGLGPIKPAPWALQNPLVQQWAPPQPMSQAETSSQSVRDIQMEEERQMRAEKRQEMEFALQQKPGVAPKWCNKDFEPIWEPKSPNKTKGHKTVASEEGLWATDPVSPDRDGVSPFGNDRLTKWCLNQVKALNNEMDAPTFIGTLKELESPSDIEAYIISYFGDCRPAREFLAAYLQKRHLVAPSKAQPESSSMASRAKNDSSQSRPTNPKKKKGKGTKFVVAGNALGFRAAPDPSRVNAGEIDRSDRL